jgi:hypothetical protein
VPVQILQKNTKILLARPHLKAHHPQRIKAKGILKMIETKLKIRIIRRRRRVI